MVGPTSPTPASNALPRDRATGQYSIARKGECDCVLPGISSCKGGVSLEVAGGAQPVDDRTCRFQAAALGVVDAARAV